MYTYTDIMATKTISIKTKGSILEFAGIWKDMTDKDTKDMKNAIRKTKKSTRMKEILEKFDS